MDVCSVDKVREGQTVWRHDRLHTEQHVGCDTYRTSCRRWYIPHIMQEVIQTAHHAGGDTYRTSCRRWYIPHIIQEVIHTAHHAGGDTNRTSCRRWYIPHTIQEVIQTAHHAGGDTYRTLCKRWYIRHIMQEVIHTKNHATLRSPTLVIGQGIFYEAHTYLNTYILVQLQDRHFRPLCTFQLSFI
jgi:hypothetical protein